MMSVSRMMRVRTGVLFLAGCLLGGLVTPTTIARADTCHGPVTAAFRRDPPFWTLSWDGKRVLARIPRAAFGHAFFILRQVVDARPRGGSVIVGTENTPLEDAAALDTGNHAFQWQAGPGDSVTLVSYVSETGPDASLRTFPIIHRDADGTVLADVDPFFLGHWRDGPPTLRSVAASHAAASHLEVDAPEAMGEQHVLWHWSIAPLPDVPMRPRFWDPRLGFFAEPEVHAWGQNGEGASSLPTSTGPARDLCVLSATQYLTRWRLEKRDPTAAVSDVVHPIAFYIDPATPPAFVPWVKRGVEEWLPAFEAIGLRHALVVREVDGSHGSAESLVDASHNVIYWGTYRGGLEGLALPVIDPRSGEIVHATIVLYADSLRTMWQFMGDSARFPFADSIAGPLVQAMVAHEVGHSLGLQHNFAEPYAERLHQASFVHREGVTASVMGFHFFDKEARPEDHIPLPDLFNRVGAYDRFAIAWAYRPIPVATPTAEIPWLRREQAAQDTARYLRTTAADSLCGGKR